MHTGRDGFTLIELAIVLVIIGLIVGGTLVGRDLIKVAQLRAEITQIDQFRAAFTTFQGKYNTLPGDMINADKMIGGVTTGHNGDGDGLLGWGATITGDQGYGEIVYVWEHLSRAGLIPGNYTGALDDDVNWICSAGCPTSKVRVDASFLLGTEGSWYTNLYNQNGSEDNVLYLMVDSKNGDYGSGAYNVADVQALDAKIDDGKASTGALLAINAEWGASGCVTGDYTVTDGSANYDLAGNDTQCLWELKF